MLATYNGEKYIEEQISSILNQTYQDWILFIRDDGSTDSTCKIIDCFAAKYPSKIVRIIDDGLSCGNAKSNFAAIHIWVNNNYDFNYFMFSDQDDVWKEDKIELTVAKMKDLESMYSGPILVHTDLEVVDSDLKTIGPSFFGYRALNPEVTDLPHLLVQNNVTGCTMCWNKQLDRYLDLSHKSVAMHDWWIALVASAFGRIGYIRDSTIKYRQHSNNVIGATKVNSLSFVIKRLFGSSHVRETIEMSYRQAAAFREQFAQQLTPDNLKVIDAFISIRDANKISRIIKIIKGGYLKQGIVQAIGELLYV